jgi:hypothetical protein
VSWRVVGSPSRLIVATVFRVQVSVQRVLESPKTSVIERNARALVKFSESMALSLGKLLYPRLQPDQRRREMRVRLTALLTGLVTADIMVLVSLRRAEIKIIPHLGRNRGP